MGDQHYAMARLSECGRTLQFLTAEMPARRQAVEKHRQSGELDKAKEAYKELESHYRHLLDTITEINLLLSEAELHSEAAYAGKLYEAVKGFNLMTAGYDKFTGAVGQLLTKLPTEDENGTVNAAVIGRLMNSVRMGYYPTDLAHVALMRRAVAFPDAKVNLLDPCCGCGLALHRLASGQNADSYGVELDESRAEEAQERLDRVGFGSFFHSRISHEAFHMLFLNPPYLSVMNEEGGRSRHEKRFLVDGICHLMPDGLLMYIIPHYRLTADVCRILCDNFTDLRVYRFSDSEFKRFKQIVVFGVRIKRTDGSEKAEELLNLAMNPGGIPPLDGIGEGLYALPDAEKRVDCFKGAQFNVRELAEQLKRSKSIEKLFEKSRLDSMTRRPLLPLNIGQVGLIGGSGLINGLVECDTPHIIKGRIVKETKREVDEDTYEMTETRVNRMVFNILTPEGFLSLA
jgi:methylase of polypeptide subunit release factors